MLIIVVGLAVIFAMAGAAFAFAICTARFRVVQNQNLEILREIQAAQISESETVKSLGGLWKETEKQTGALSSLLNREDVSGTVQRIELLLEDAGTRAEEEAAMSKAMEEGISNLLGYSVGKGPGAAT